MIEMRWVRQSNAVAEPAKLQFRVYRPEIDFADYYRGGEWTEWEDVPLHIEGEDNGR